MKREAQLFQRNNAFLASVQPDRDFILPLCRSSISELRDLICSGDYSSYST